MIFTGKRRTNQKGNALLYVLIAIALLAALTVSLMDTSGQQVSSQKTNDLAATLKSQISLIQMAIQECALAYPEGDPGYTAGFSKMPYPLHSDDPYLTSPAATSYTKDIRCPGNPGNSNNHARIFGGNSGKTFPPPIPGFYDWLYYNFPTGIFIMVMTTRTDSYIDAAFKKVEASYAKCEADIIDGRTAAKVIADAGWNCPAGNICLRVWLQTTPSSVFPDESGCP